MEKPGYVLGTCDYVIARSADCGFVPVVPEIQDLVYSAWETGIDYVRCRAVDQGHADLGKDYPVERAWVGRAMEEVHTLPETGDMVGDMFHECRLAHAGAAFDHDYPGGVLADDVVVERAKPFGGVSAGEHTPCESSGDLGHAVASISVMFFRHPT